MKFNKVKLLISILMTISLVYIYSTRKYIKNRLRFFESRGSANISINVVNSPTTFNEGKSLNLTSSGHKASITVTVAAIITFKPSPLPTAAFINAMLISSPRSTAYTTTAATSISTSACLYLYVNSYTPPPSFSPQTQPQHEDKTTIFNHQTPAPSPLWSKYEDTNSPARVPEINLPVDCKKLFGNEAAEITKARSFESYHETDADKALLEETRQSKQMLLKTNSCEEYIQMAKFIVGPTTTEEQDFPIAYSILVFRDILQIEKLLRAIYRSQNYYCIHLDSKATTDMRKGVEALTSCFPNVFMSSRSVNVTWATFSVLEPELICMDDLLKYSAKWKYFINLTGQEWPLKTNKELVSILKAYNGGNDVEGSVKRADPARYENLFDGQYMLKENVPNPVKITMVKGSVHIVVQRGFANYVVNSEGMSHCRNIAIVSKKFAGWLNGTWAPDETFFASLNHSPHLNIPGSYLGEPETEPQLKPFLARFKNWGNWPFDYPCQGKWVKQICVFGIGDLWFIRQRKELFANKFYIDFEPMTLNCMEQWHYQRTKEDLDGTSKFDVTYYKNLPFAKYHTQ